MFYDILDKERLEILPDLAAFKNRFYLAGGTGLALQIGHRDSVDFDFFREDHFDSVTLYTELVEVFAGRKLEKTLEDKDSLNVVVGDKIKLGFLRYPYVLLRSCLEEEYLKLASLEDIGCMKLSAVTGRSLEKDYVDLYFILQQVSLRDLLLLTRQKMPDLGRNLILKSLVYFQDVTPEAINFKHQKAVDFAVVKNFLEKEVLSL